jgi:hypothetical protein
VKECDAHTQKKSDRFELEKVLKDQGAVAQLGNGNEKEVNHDDGYINSYGDRIPYYSQSFSSDLRTCGFQRIINLARKM